MKGEFVKSSSGLFVLDDASIPNVERANFEVKVQGFAPVEDKKIYRGGDHRRNRMVAFASEGSVSDENIEKLKAQLAHYETEEEIAELLR